MKIINAIKSGSLRSAKAWKGVLITWFASLILVSLLALPIKRSLNSAFGKSMATEKLMDGVNLDIVTDLGPSLSAVFSSFSAGLLMLVLTGMLVNAFLAGGMFSCLRESSKEFTGTGFFSSSAKNFWSFLVISLLICLMFLALIFVVIGLPVSMISQSVTISEPAAFALETGCGILFFLLSAILVLVADYARAWQVANDKSACFNAIGFGFSRTFGKFFTSFPLIIIILFAQLAFAFLFLKIIGSWTPVKGGGVFLLFILTQFFIYVRFYLKAWRYASVTSLMEQDYVKTDVVPEFLAENQEAELHELLTVTESCENVSDQPILIPDDQKLN
ncbi:MAG TPA: hypothetical protein PKM69_04500 [Bacteroidales bacterium]|nr:hypothetical protein [Bacteroidales bacterium]